MNLKKMMIGSALLMAACCMQAQTKAIAHRGFWKTPGSSQNSITSRKRKLVNYMLICVNPWDLESKYYKKVTEITDSVILSVVS